MDTSMGDDITLNDILQRNFKKQSWDPWLHNSYLCADEQPVQPLAHDPNAQESMSAILQMKQYMRTSANPEDVFMSAMNSARANQDTAKYNAYLKKWQENYSLPQTSKFWYLNSDPNAQRVIFPTNTTTTTTTTNTTNTTTPEKETNSTKTGWFS